MRALYCLCGLLFAAAPALAQDPASLPGEPGSSDTPGPESTPELQPPDQLVEVPPDPTGAGPGPMEEELSEADLANLGFSGEEGGLDTSVRLSGFIDFGTEVALTDATEDLIGKSTMFVGNLNLYITKNISETVRMMAEIRFTYLPNGASTNPLDPPANTTTADYADFDRALRWGGIEIERVYLDWAAHRFLTIRVGQFLTPYGIWNVDHGSPTIITVSRPYSVGDNFFPERQTGFEFFGRSELSSYGTIGYHLTFSNGTGPASEYKDLDKNKAVGARAFFEYRKLGELKIGGSIYYGRDTASLPTTVPVNGELVFGEKITTQADILALAADASWRYRGIHLQAEFISRQMKYTDSGRTQAFSLATLSPSYPADSLTWGGYILGGYRFDWLGVMPYFMFEYMGGHDPTFQSIQRSPAFFAGINMRPLDAVAIKFEYAFVHFDQPFPPDDLQFFNAQLAWAF
jgi:hypothetical protein